MSRMMSVPLQDIPKHFKALDFTTKEMLDILFGLVYVWRHSELIEDITNEYIFSELDLDPLAAQMLILNIGPKLSAIGTCIRDYSLAGRLISWKVKPYLILLELEHEDLYPLSSRATTDRSTRNARGLSYFV